MINTNSPIEIALLCANAHVAAHEIKRFEDGRVADLLDAIADGMNAEIDSLVPIAMEESNLPEARLRGEVGRTTNQLKMFASDVRSGRWKNETSVDALPDRQPLPRPALHRFHLPIGPVAVFGASNFPFAFSVAGGDTASALAAKCPVIVKAHSAHIRTSEAVGAIISAVVAKHDFPAGTFTLLNTDIHGAEALVMNEHIQGVGFTGSQRVGRLLMDMSAKRQRPIPVFAEMGSVNPLFLLPGALEQRGESIGASYAQSLTMGVGQFCTNPGIVFGLVGDGWDAFTNKVVDVLSNVAPQKMLHEGIGESYLQLTEERLHAPNVQSLIRPALQGAPGLARVDFATYISNPSLHEEVFGPFGILVECSTVEEYVEAAKKLDGQLTGSIFHGDGDEAHAEELAHVLEDKVGRLIFNQYPTGLEVCDAMQHGGPYPAASDVRFTSVGNHAILRWLRPICYQNKPDFMNQ